MFVGCIATIGRAVAVAVSALKFASAGTGWTLSNNNTKASKTTTTSSEQLVLANISKSQGPAAVSYTVGGMPSDNTQALIGIAPPDTVLDSSVASDRFTWRADGLIIYNGSVVDSISSYTTGDVLVLRLSASGTTVTALKNGTSLGAYDINAVSRVPSIGASGSGFIVTINGAPAGETAWG